MNKFFQLFVAFLLAVSNPLSAHASTFGTASTYSGITWAVYSNASGFTGCTNLLLDATGDMKNASSFVLSGTLNCPALGGGYGVVGSLYLGTNGTFNMNVLVGAGVAMQCVNMVGLSGTCVFTSSVGTRLGTGTLTFIN